MKKEYLSVCDKCYRKTWYSEEQQCHYEYPKEKICKTCGHSETLEPMKMERCTGTLRLIDNSMLSDRLTPYYDTGERIEIEYKDGSKERGTIGKSTGWKPIYILLKRRNSISGEAILTDFIKNIYGKINY